MGQGAQMCSDTVQCREQYVISGLLQHQAIGQVVDVLAGASEMDKLQVRGAALYRP